MLKLASNESAALFKCGREYWMVWQTNWHIMCLNDQSNEYNATNALAYFQERCGKAHFVHPDLKRH